MIKRWTDEQLLKRLANGFPSGMTLEQYRKLTDQPDGSTCTHLKGGHGDPNAILPREDYAISNHEFTDGHREIKCMICGKLFELRTPEVRYMMRHTTNGFTSSEVLHYETNWEPKELKEGEVDGLKEKA
jgi:hypothetical protein